MICTLPPTECLWSLKQCLKHCEGYKVIKSVPSCQWVYSPLGEVRCICTPLVNRDAWGQALSILLQSHLAGGITSDQWEITIGEKPPLVSTQVTFLVISVTPTTRLVLSFALLMVDFCGFVVGDGNGWEVVEIILHFFLLSSFGKSSTQSFKFSFWCGHHSLLLKNPYFPV